MDEQRNSSAIEEMAVTGHSFTLLIVEDDPDDLRMIMSLLDKDERRNYQFEHCGTLSSAIDRLSNETFDAVVLDLGLPDSKGLETLTSIQEHNIETPMVILTELDDESFAEKALRLGFEEYVPKSALKSSRIDWQIKQAVERHKVTRAYYERATVDALTGVHNRAYFDEVLDRAVSEHDRSKEAMALALIDVDDFKSLNDEYGHAEGDKALKALGEALNFCKRKEDVVARIGGDEFVLLMVYTEHAAGASHLLKRIRSDFDERIAKANLATAPTLSIGVAWHKPKMSAQQLYEQADGAMYQAKKLGKGGLIILN